MNSLGSALIIFDGESKCGKTTIINSVQTEAEYQQGVIPNLLVDGSWSELLGGSVRDELQAVQEALNFNSVTTVSAGNSFRAASLYLSLLELQGLGKMSFDSEDEDKIREVLAIDGITDVLQDDPNVANRVSQVAALEGAQALCSTVFCDFIQGAYNFDGGGNLVIADGRDIVRHLKRNNIVGTGDGMITPQSIIPVFVDTPEEVAASRLKGDYEENLHTIKLRREQDRTRPEMPFTRPSELVEDLNVWLSQFGHSSSREDIAVPFRLDNGESTSLDNIQYFGGVIVELARRVAYDNLRVKQNSL